MWGLVIWVLIWLSLFNLSRVLWVIWSQKRHFTFTNKVRLDIIRCGFKDQEVYNVWVGTCHASFSVSAATCICLGFGLACKSVYVSLTLICIGWFSLCIFFFIGVSLGYLCVHWDLYVSPLFLPFNYPAYFALLSCS